MTAVIAHRGATRHARENTVEAFRAAREVGADWVELDVRRTANDVMVVHHDAHLDDGTPIVELADADLPAWLPTLAEAFEACEGLGVNVEIKNPPEDPDYDADNQISEAVAGLVVAYRSYADVLVSSFNRDSLARIRAVDPQIRTGILTFDVASADQLVEWATASGHVAVSPYVAFVDRSLVTRAHDAGLDVNVWTVDEEDKLVELVELGVEGIVTNQPELARRVVDAAAG